MALGGVGVATETTQCPDLAAEGAIFDTLTVVASKLERPLTQTAGAVTVVGRDRIEARMDQDLADLLRGVPGVSATGAAGRFGVDGIRMRGVEGARVAITVDGVSAPDGFSIGSFSRAGRAVIEPELVGSLEVLRGPASVLYGSDALGGVLAIRTREPSDLLGEGGAGARRVRLGYDTRDAGVRASLVGAMAIDGWRALALATARRSEEIANRGQTPPDPASIDRRSALLKLERWGAVGPLTLGLERFELASQSDLQHLVHGPAPFTTTEGLLADDRQRRSRVSLRQGFDSSPASADGWAQLAWVRDELVQETTQWRSPDARTPVPTRRDRRFDYAEERILGESIVERSFQARSVVHRVAFGASAEWVELRELRDGSETDLSSGATSSVVLGEVLPVRDFPISQTRSLGASISDELIWEAWRIQLALRFDHDRTRARADEVYRSDFGAEVVDQDDYALTPRLAVTRALGPRHSLHLIYAEGFRAPPAHDTNVGFRLAALGYEARPNPDLRSERSRGAELGWRYAGRGGGFHLSGYENRYRDLIESRVNLGSEPGTGIVVFQSVNRERARIRGFEGHGWVDLGSRWAVARGWRVDLGFSVEEGEDVEREVPLDSVDPASATLELAWRAPSGRWSASAIATAVDGKAGAVSAPHVVAPPGYQLLDLLARFDLGRSVTATVGIFNAFDTAYWSYAATRRLSAHDPQLDLYTAPGRSLVVGIEVRR